MNKLDFLDKWVQITNNVLYTVLGVCFLILFLSMGYVYLNVIDGLDHEPLMDNPELRGNVTANMDSAVQLISIYPLILVIAFLFLSIYCLIKSAPFLIDKYFERCKK